MQSEVSVKYFESYLNSLELLGLDKYEVYDLLGITPEDLTNYKFRVSVADVTRAFDYASERINEPNVGLRVGLSFRPNQFPDGMNVLLYAPTIAHAILVNQKYAPLEETVGLTHLERRQDGDYVTWDMRDIDPNAHRHICEVIMSSYAVTSNWLSWAMGFQIEEVGFRHAQPKGAPEMTARLIEQVFRCPVRYNCHENYVRYAKYKIDLRMPSSNPDKFQDHSNKLDVILNKVRKMSTLVTRIEHEIIMAMRRGGGDFKSVCDSMAVSERSLRRRLREQGTNFREQVELTRKKVCLAYLEDGRSFTEISMILCYNDQSAFTRAFKRWFGVSPSKYLQSMAEEDTESAAEISRG